MAEPKIMLLHAAGSLKAALTDILKAYEAASGYRVDATFGPSGLLKDDIFNGARAGVFASANIEHPRALQNAGLCGEVVLFARNDISALVRPGLNVISDTLLPVMLRPTIAIGTSTPQADPSGDYAFAVFARAEKLVPDARIALESKARMLTGSRTSLAPPDGVNVYGWHVMEGRADIFLTYHTNVIAARQQFPALQSVALPETLAVSGDYGLVVLNGAPPQALELARLILSPEGQSILQRHGFAPGQMSFARADQ